MQTTTNNNPVQTASLGGASISLRVGDRIQAGAWCDCWICGDRFGDVVKVGRHYVHVKMTRSGRVIKFHPANIGEIVN